jgi:hypothetical protein
VEIKDAKENDLRPSVQTYSFEMTAAINTSAATDGQAKAQATGAAQTPQPAAKGRS